MDPYYQQPYRRRSIYSVDINRSVVDQRTIFKITFIIILIVVLYFVFYPYIKKKWIALFGTKVRDTPYKLGGGTVDDNFIKYKAESYVKAMNDAISNDSWWSRNTDNCDVYKRFCNELTDNQLIYVANSYKNTYTDTLRKKITDAGTSTCGFFDTDYSKMLLDKLNSLNIP